MQKILFCLFVLLLSVPQCLKAQVIKINVQKGQKYLFESSTTISDSNNIGGMILQTTNEYKSTSIYEVADIEKKEITFQTTITRIISKSSIMGEESTYDSDTDKESPEAKLFSKNIDKSKKITIDNNGIIIKRDLPEKSDNPMGDWNWAKAQSATELFVPLFIGKEFKLGANFTYIDSFTVEKNSTSFSLNKEKVDSRDTGIYTITSIENGIANVTYSGTRVFSMLMNMKGKPMNSISKSVIKSTLTLNINTGMLINMKTKEEATIFTGNNDTPFISTNKNSSIINVTLIQ